MMFSITTHIRTSSFREGGRFLAVASLHHAQVKLYCPRTGGALCQQIVLPIHPGELMDEASLVNYLTGNGLAPMGWIPLVLGVRGVLGLLRRDGHAEGEGEEGGRRPHFLVVRPKEVREQ